MNYAELKRKRSMLQKDKWHMTERIKELTGQISEYEAYQKEQALMIMLMACDYFRMPMSLMTNCCRERWIVDARHITMTVIREHTGLTMALIGSMFNKGYCDVIHAIRKVNDLYDTDKAFQYYYNAFNEQINGKDNLEVPVKNCGLSKNNDAGWGRNINRASTTIQAMPMGIN